MTNQVLKNFHKEENIIFNVCKSQVFIKIMYEL